MTRRSTGRKILQSIGVVATWASVVGLGTFGTFTDPATPLTGIRDDAPARLHAPVPFVSGERAARPPTSTVGSP